MLGSYRSRKHLAEYRQNILNHEAELRNHFVHNEPLACQAQNIEDLLTEKWSEGRDKYRLMTKIKVKEEERIKRIIDQNRYSSLC